MTALAAVLRSLMPQRFAAITRAAALVAEASALITYRSEGFAEDLCDTHPSGGLRKMERRPSSGRLTDALCA